MSNLYKLITGIGNTATNRIGMYAFESVPLQDDTVSVALCGGENKVGVLNPCRLLYAIVGCQFERVDAPYIQLPFADAERVVIFVGGSKCGHTIDENF